MPGKIIPPVISNLKDGLNKVLGEDLKNVILFGSRAEKEAHKESDYDILIILNSESDKNCRNTILNVIYNIELKHDIFIDFKIISTYELNQTLRGKLPIFTDAVNNGFYL